MRQLEIKPAGAGSGKTYAIQETLASLVSHSIINPERIVAVTFTESAAAELRERIRSVLVRQNRLEDALKIDQAYITTIHGFALRIITEFAFDAGLSPRPRLLSDDEKDMLMRLALTQSSTADAIKPRLKELGYDSKHGVSPENYFRDRIFTLIDHLRGIGREGSSPEQISFALEFIENLYGQVKNEQELKDRLVSAINRLLSHYPCNLSETAGSNKSAKNELNDNYFTMKRAVKNQGAALDKDFKIWQKLRNLRLKIGKTPIPGNYDKLAGEVMEAANMLPVHPGPLKEALWHIQHLIETCQDCIGSYSTNKRERGLVDFADMPGMCNRILDTFPEILNTLKDRVDFMVVDEFQDTNPLQFSMLWKLSKAGVPTLIVGDTKQAIMGFQGADARLLGYLEKRFSESVTPLTNNWRSTPAIMDFINSIGHTLFGEAYQSLSVRPEAKFPTEISSIEAVSFVERSSTDVMAHHTALRLRKLLDDKTQRIFDKTTKTMRPIRGSDIAIICPKNKILKNYASALRALGIPSHIEEEGWIESRIIQILWHALSYVADPGDRHAALYLSVTEFGGYTLDNALSTLLKKEPLQDPILTALEGVIAVSMDMPVYELVNETISALDAFGRIAEWPDAGQSRANLIRLLGEVDEFENANRDALACGSFYGYGLKTFLAWLKSRAERDDKQPAPYSADENSVQIMTWHRSKGREWPIVAVCGMNDDITPRLPAFDVTYTHFENLENILSDARLRIFPDYAAPEQQERVRETLWDETIQNARRLIYVAITRAREKLVLELPVYLDGKDLKSWSYWDMLKEAAHITLGNETINIGEKSFPCCILACRKAKPADFEDYLKEEDVGLPLIGRRAINPGNSSIILTPEFITPSSLEGQKIKRIVDLREEAYGPGFSCELPVNKDKRGLLLHAAFELLIGHPERQNFLSDATNIQLDIEQSNAIAVVVASFENWVEQALSPTFLNSEVPILHLDESGCVVSGFVDLIVETADGIWIIDHKSDIIKDRSERFLYYLPQLECYAEALSRANKSKPVKGVAINWITSGIISIMDYEQE